MLHDERVSYFTLKLWAMDSYFDACRDHAVTQGWSYEQVMGYVSYTFEEGFERPVENLMWQVILLILGGGWNVARYNEMYNVLQGQIAELDLDALLHGVPEEEVAIFLHDLSVLGLTSRLPRK